MPIYEFECSRCQNRFDELVRADVEVRDILCPKCGADAPKKLVSAFGFSSGGKTVTSASAGGGCQSCHSGHCATCR
jgi:putative FmdB family regulatory protein